MITATHCHKTQVPFFLKKTKNHTAPLTELLIATEIFGSIYYCQNTE